MSEPCRICRSHAINPGHHGRPEWSAHIDNDLCDVCFWKTRYEKLDALFQELGVAFDHPDEVLAATGLPRERCAEIFYALKGVGCSVTTTVNPLPKPDKIEIGQLWRRKDGNVVRVADERVVRNMREVQLVPAGSKGRASWKWAVAVRYELEYVGMKG